MQTVHFIDSHTGGEPTRVVIDGGPDLGGEPLPNASRASAASTIASVGRGRTSRAAPTCSSARSCRRRSIPAAAAGVIFFNNVGYLGMCGHGTIGLVTTLAWLGRLGPGLHRIETPVGVVTTELHAVRSGVGAQRARLPPRARHRGRRARARPRDGRRRLGRQLVLPLGTTTARCSRLANVEALVEFGWRVRQALTAAGVSGAGGAEIDHVELRACRAHARLDSRNFVLCPGKAYDRSPCGTGTSAKLACLVADGKLAPGGRWRQESIVGSVFEGCVEERDGQLWPFIRSSAFVTAEGRLVLDENDPFRWGIRP